MSVLQNLSDMGYEIVLCTTEITKEVNSICVERGISVINIKIDFDTPINPLSKLSRLGKVKRELWKQIDLIYNDSSIIWVFSDAALKHLGKKLLKKKYILHMFELSEKTYYYYKLPILSMDMSKYAKGALRVIQAEYNRAHIVKSWWGLNDLPAVLPNKPYLKKTIEKKSKITDLIASSVIEQLKGRKIILYQGNLGSERPLDQFIKAVDNLGDNYAFVIMSGSEDIYKHLNSENYFFIPYVTSPQHLEITSHAYIGVMSYIPVVNGYSKLNSLYCAPNKIYEYSMFGIPMIGNDVPGLSSIFSITGSGVCIEKYDEDSIRNAILEIENNYEEMNIKSKELYDKTDNYERIKEIIQEVSY